MWMKYNVNVNLFNKFYMIAKVLHLVEVSLVCSVFIVRFS